MTRPIATGICSFGMSGKLFHAPFVDAHPGFTLAGVVERHRDESRERYPGSKIYRSVEELLVDKRIELVIVNTPTHLHFEHTKAALAAGKHVITEKPFTVSVAEGRELEAMAADSGKFLSVYQNRRYDGDFHAVQEVLDQQLLGSIREVEIRYDRFRPDPGGKMHKEGSLPGAGVLYDLGPHLVDQALQLFGWPDALFADCWTMREGVDANDYFEVLLYYPSHRVRLKATCVARESTYAYTLHGMKGSFLQHRSDCQEQMLLQGVRPAQDTWCPEPATPDGLLHIGSDGEDMVQHTTSAPGNYMRYFDAVYHALREDGPNPVPAADGIRTIQIIEAAQQSSAGKKVISLK